MRIYVYLRSSTKDQNAERAKSEIEEFCKAKEIDVSGWFVEEKSGATLKRKRLFDLLEIANEGDAILVEQVDRLSRLTIDDWEKLKKIINEKGIKIMSLDLPTSHNIVNTSDEFTDWMLRALNTMILEMLAAISRKDYDDRRRRQKQGINRAKQAGLYKGRPKDENLRATIKAHLNEGRSYNEIVKITKCSKATISSVKKEVLASQSL